MVSSRRRIRSQSSRFLGALIGALLFLLYAAATGGVGQDPTSNVNIILLALGVLVLGGVGAWLFPWIQNRFSSHQLRRKALRDAQESASRSRKQSRSER
ncbi:hypothetical protein [Orrella marina]|uniref:Uncharacterized protein n=1 Tax=Orrella marina TaxID=2163011 RepID=A0A2R4XGM1_9BURK|nr:hypothetical protein [Orrella marina]AWB32931.1 hypothetical protein DBV39_03465 [Orrella marina]